MRHRSVLVVLIAFIAAAGDAAALHVSMTAMACCAKTHNECAGFRTADDCCKGMGRGVGATASTAPGPRAGQTAITLAVLPAIASQDLVVRVGVWTAPAFKRPHDPPHLHPVPLLI